MSTMEDVRSYCNPWNPRFTRESQLAQLHGEVYEEDKTGKVVDALIQSVRKGTIVEVVELGLLAPVPKKGGSLTPLKRRKLLAERVEKIKARGGIIRELATGWQSNKGKLASMLLRAFEFIVNSGRAEAKQGKPGRPRVPMTDAQREKAALVWASRKHKNDAERVAAIKKAIGISLTPSWCWRHLKSPHGTET